MNDTILPTGSWNQIIFISMKGGCDRVSVDLKDAYLGIMHNNNFGYIHVRPLENNGIEVVEYAINLTENSSIYAGQKN
jgi:hypothetical protein